MELNRAMFGAEITGGFAGVDEFSSGQRLRWTLGEMVGTSAAMERLFLQMRYLANHVRVALIEGERGTGKRTMAETLHGLSAREGVAFVACDARLFLGETTVRADRLAEAEGGTLYLSGVDTLELTQQMQLLQLAICVQQHGRGLAAGSRMFPVLPKRLFVASRRSLRGRVQVGAFRGDVQQQLAAVYLAAPSLRERREDIPLLAETFLTSLAFDRQRGRRRLSQDALQRLMAYGWPGNVGELRAVLVEAAATAKSDWITAEDLMPAMPEPALRTAVARGKEVSVAPGATRLGRESWGAAQAPAIPAPASQEASRSAQSVAAAIPVPAVPRSTVAAPTLLVSDPNLDRAILRHIRRVLASVDGNKLRAAKLLGISRSTLYRLLEGQEDAGVGAQGCRAS